MSTSKRPDRSSFRYLYLPQRNRVGRRRSPLFLVLLIVLWSALLGWGFAQATDLAPIQHAETGAVDVIPEQYQLGHELYLENCATCHVGVPPQVFPRETWRQLLQDSQHYGVQISLVDPPRLLVWEYLQYFSRGLREDEAVPYRVNNSRYFKILHPNVELDRPTRLTTCITCHPAADQFNFRQLAPDWQGAS
ncbi:MAG: diheme cytochrome C [Elainellaceae cyanobacterium]